MGIISALGSVAINTAKTYAANKVAKAITKASSTKKEASVVPKEQAPLPDDTKLYQDLNVTTWVGGYGEGQTVDTIEKWMQTRAYRPELVKELYDTKEYGASIWAGSYDIMEAKKLSPNTFNATKELNLESTIGQIKIGKSKAQSDVNDFLTNPSSTIAKSFKANVWEEKYNQYVSLINKKNSYKDAIAFDKSSAYESSGIRWYLDLPIIKTIVNKATGWEYGAFTAAINESEAEWKEGLTSKGAYYTANLLGGWLMYGGLGWAWRLGVTKGLSEIGFSVGWSTGGEIVKVANTIERIASKSPTLYAATVDNGVSSALEYGITKSLWGDYSTSDFINNLIVWAAVPLTFKGIWDSYGFIKWVTPKDTVALEKAVTKHMQSQGSTTVKEAVDAIADTHVFEDGETLAKKIDNYKATTPKNPDWKIDYPEVQSTFANQGQSISTRAAKKVANVISKLNEKIKGEADATGWYWAMGSDDSIQITKRAVIDNLAGEPVINAEVAEKAIKKAFDENGMKYNEWEYKIANDTSDDVDEMFHTSSSKPEAIPTATTVGDLSEAIEGKKVISMRNIDDARFDVDNLNRAGAKSTKELADNAGVKFDWDKAVDTEGKTNKQYLHKVLDDIETTTTWYGKFSQKITTGIKKTIASIEDNLKKATKFDAVGLGKEALDNIKTIKGEVSALTKRLKWATAQVEKNAIKSAIDKKNLQIESIKTKAKTKLSDISITRTLVRAEIDSWATRYSNLSKSTLAAAKNKYKAMVSSSTSIKRAAEIVENFHKEMYTKAIRANENEADNLITKVLKAARSKTKKSIVTKDTIDEMMEFYRKFSSAKVEGDLVKMQEAIDNLNSVYDNGRSEFKANIEKAKADTRNIWNEVINELKSNADGEFRMRNVNTPEAWMPMEKDSLQNIGIFVEGMVGTHLQFSRLFGENSIITKIFYKPFVAANSLTEATKIKLFKNLSEVKDWMKGYVSWSYDSRMAKYTLWRNSKSTWWKGGTTTAKEYNMNNDMVFGIDKDGKWQYIPVSDTAQFKQKNAGKFEDGSYVHFWDDNPNKETILNSIYSEFDNAYKSSTKFKAAEDAFRSHYDAVGNKNGGLMQRLYNKPFEVVNNYNPIAMWRKSSRDELVGTNWNLDNYYRESVSASHTISRTWPWEKVRMVLDPTEILTRHVHGAVYWGNVIEPLRNAQALLNVLKRGKSFLANPLNIDASIQRDLGTVGDDAFKTIPNVDGDVDRIGIGDRIMSDETVNFLETNLEKYATQWGNLGMKVQLGQDAVFGKTLSRTYQYLLTGVKTPFKQVMSLFDIYTATGEKNSMSALRGVKNLDNLSLMIKESGIFAERVPNAISKSELWRSLRFNSSRTKFWRAQDATEYIGTVIMGNMIKAFDWFSSANAFLAWVSRHLDLYYPELHVAWRNLNLEDIKAKLVKLDSSGNIIDDSEWRAVVTEGEIMMSKIMGSNATVDTPLAAKGILGRVTWFMGKSAINRMVSMWDTVIRGSLDKNLSSDSYKATDKLINVARFTLAGVMMQGYITWLNKQKDKLDVAIGAKAQDTIDIKNEADAKSYIDEINLIIDSQFFMPSIGVEIMKSTDPAVKYVKDFNSLQTTERKVQEGAEAWLQTLIPLHNDIYNVLKYGATLSSKMDFTNVGEKEFDKAATTAANQYGGNKSAKDYSPENDKWNGLTWVEQKILISKQIEFDKASQEKSKIEKPIKDIQDKFVKDAVNKYWKDITPQQLHDEAVANPEFAKTIEITELESYYTKIQAAGAKTTWEKDSILMGKSTDAIFDVEIKPLMEAGKAWDAFERVKEMRQKGIIKSDNWAVSILKLMKEYQDAELPK